MARTTADKLQIKPGSTVWASHADRLDLVGPLPSGATTAAGLGTADVAVVFADDAAGLRKILDRERAHLAKPGVFWVAYPKANRTDVNRDSLWSILAEYGLRPNSQVAIDDSWSALRFRALRDGETPFAADAKAGVPGEAVGLRSWQKHAVLATETCQGRGGVWRFRSDRIDRRN
jgi:hypothetical protein